MEISLDEIIKSINFETNKYPGNDGLTAEFQMFMTPGESLAPWLLRLEQESA